MAIKAAITLEIKLRQAARRMDAHDTIYEHYRSAEYHQEAAQRMLQKKVKSNLMHHIELPPDHFNVLVENEMDKARLLWLVNEIGEAKLRKSVAKYQSRWPGSQPFVSTLLKWYHLTVPVAVYAPVRIPVYWLYLLRTNDGSEVKVGYTGSWPQRVFAYLPLHRKPSDVFDLVQSHAYLVGGDKSEVLSRERAIKAAFSPWRSRPDSDCNEGKTEWFIGAKFEEIVRMAVSLEEGQRVTQTLGSALELIGLLDKTSASQGEGT